MDYASARGSDGKGYPYGKLLRRGCQGAWRDPCVFGEGMRLLDAH